MHKMSMNLLNDSHPFICPHKLSMFRFDMNLLDFSSIFKGEKATIVKEKEEERERSPPKSQKISNNENAQKDKEKEETNDSSKECKQK